MIQPSFRPSVSPQKLLAPSGRRRTVRSLLAMAGVAAGFAALAQTPVVLPNSISTLAGGGSTTTASSPCVTGSPYTATDAFGDGCPAAQVGVGANEWGVGTDRYGNVYALDNTNSVVHKIDARSGLLSKVAGAGTVSSSCQQTAIGDGCLAATQTSGFNSRNMSTDSYGNVVLPDYGHSFVHLICNTVSPLCSAAQIGYMLPIAGSAPTTTSGGSSGGVSGTTAGTAGDGTKAFSTSTTTGVAGPRGGSADIYGNVYIADTANNRYRVVLGPASYNSVTNPLFNIIKLNSTYSSPSAGYIYPILGGVTAPSSGAYCNGGSTGPKALDALGDGCPFYNASSTSSPYGVTTDAYGNVLFADTSNKRLRVLYVGGAAMAALITLENTTITTPTVGSVYSLAGAGGTGVSATATLGSSTAINNPSSVTVDVAGNIYAGENSTNDVLFLDINTGYVRVLFVKGTTCNSTSYGDGCPVSQSVFGGGSYTLPIALDGLGNLYLGDQTNSLVRKVSASSLIPMTIGTGATQKILVHEPSGVTGITAALTTSSPDVAIGTPTCVTNGDTTYDCTITATLTPSAPGLRSAALVVTPSGSSSTTVYPLAGVSTGSALVTDNAVSTTAGSSPVASSAEPTPTALGSETPLSVAVDGAGNVYSVDSTSLDFSVYVPGGGNTLLSQTAPTGVSQIAVDTLGNVYAVASGSTSITKLTVTGSVSSSYTRPTYSSSTISYTPATTPAKPQGIAVDNQGNYYVSDGTNGAVYKASQGSTLQPLVVFASGLTNPTLLALDLGGNLYVYDAGATTIYKYTAAGVKSTFLSSVTATGIATDAALNVYVQTATGVKEYPATGPTTQVYSGGTTPNGIALDGVGNVYISDAGNTGILEANRAALTYNFGTGSSNSPTLTGTLTNVGNQNATGGNPATTSTSFSIVAGASNGCSFTLSTEGAQLYGNACTFSANLVGTGSSTVTDTLTYLPASTKGSLSLSGTLVGTSVGTTTTISGQTPTSPVYASSGTEVTFTVTVAPASGTTAPSGNVAVTVDTTTTYQALSASGSNGVATVTLSGLTAGMHSISATYPTSGSFTGSSTASATNFSIAQASTSTAWTPATTTQQYSAPLGNGALNAAATSGGVSVPGAYVYTATPTGGAAQEVHAASYLAIGTYALNVTFYPTDAVDYTQSTASVASFTVTQATTTAPIGGSQFLVATDGSGNYTTVQAAVNALGVNGGSVYIKPGTYGETTYNDDTNGSITIVQPNVALRGLGGDPTKVILSHSGGAFGSSYAYVANAYTVAQDNGSQLPSGSTVQTGDPGSATLVVAQGVNTGLGGSTTKYYPSNFYAENLTVNNVYNTDPTGTTTAYLTTAGNQATCSATAGPAQTYSYIYNNNLECGSQALAIYTIADTSVLNNVYANSLQDTVYAGSISTGSAVAARQYWFRGEISGDVDYIFGDAAAVFDHMSIYSAWHGTSATGTDTIEAQNAGTQAGASGSYLSGYIMNSDIFTSQSTGMSNLYFGRPYGTYSTWIMLNSYVDQLNAGTTPGSGYTTGLGPTLSSATYGEYNDHTYTDPSVGTADANGVLYPANGQNSLATGGNTGQNVLPTTARENVSTNPGYGAFTANGSSNNVGLTVAQAQQFYPVAFFSKTVTTPSSDNNGVAVATTWDPTAAIKSDVNAFVPASGSPSSITAGQSLTLLMRPQTPGLGAVSAGVYTIPTGTYTLYDNNTQIATGSLDASGEATYISSSLAIGNHSFTWSYGGDGNFAGSTTSTAYALTVNGVATTTTLSETNNPINYGQSASVSATVSTASGTPTGSVTLTIDGTTTQTQALSGGATTFTVTGLSAGSHSFTASYGGSALYATSATTSSLPLTVSQLPLVVTGSCTNRAFYTANSCSASVSGSYGYSDSAATVFATGPTGTTTATVNSPAGTYPTSASYTLTTAGATNYSVTTQSGTTFTITGSASSAQSVVFPPLPPLPSGTYQLSARSSSGLPVTYTVTGAGASISGNTLVLSGATGNTITVTATQTDTTYNDYATATASRSFIAQ